MTKLADGTKELPSQTKQLADGAQKSADGADDLADGVKQYTGGVTQLNKQLQKFSPGSATPPTERRSSPRGAGQTGRWAPE